jgi:hypothetical protein
MKYSALVTTVNHHQKQSWLKSVVESIDSLGIHFEQKIISIDQVNEDEYSAKLISDLKHNGWEFSFVYFRNRLNTLLHEVDKIKNLGCDWLLHAEDDIIINSIPSEKIISEILGGIYGGQKCGIFTPSLGGSTYKWIKENNGDYKHVDENTIYKDSDILVFKRQPIYGGHFFFELGSFFVDINAFYKCLNYTKINFPNKQVETALTLSWFHSGLSAEYYKATYCKPEFLKIYKDNPEDIFTPNCQFVTCIDPMQGSSWYAGSQYT